MRILLPLLLLSSLSFGQTLDANTFNKERNEDLAKIYVAKTIMPQSSTPKKYFLDAVTTTLSGELTALLYDCGDSGRGLVFGFWGSRWNDYGVTYNLYKYTHLEAEKAIEMLNKLEAVVEEHRDYLGDSMDENCVTLTLEGFDFIIYNTGSTKLVRVLWDGFDSEWNYSELKRTNRRLQKKL